MAIKVLIVSEHLLLRHGLHSLFQQEDEVDIVAEAASGREVR